MDDQPELKWSATFEATANPTNRASSLQGDKFILPQSALEQLLTASTALSSSLASSANPYADSRSRPQNAFYADSHQQLPNPLMFRLVNQANGNVVHAGIREFSAPDDAVFLSAYLLEALGIDESDLTPAQSSGTSASDPLSLVDDDDDDDDEHDDDSNEPTRAATPKTRPRITIHAKQIPRGTYVRLRPLEAGYDPGDWKALLERQLRESFTTLTKGAFLSVRGVKGETFRFLIDKFQPEGDGICVVDTDLEVDIEALNEEQARETMRQIMAKAQRAPGTEEGSSVGGELSIWKDVEGRVLPGDYVDFELESWPRSRPLEITLSNLDDDDDYLVNLLISPKSTRQRAHPRDTEHVLGAFASTEPGIRRIVIPATSTDMDNAESLLVAVHGYNPDPSSVSTAKPATFKLRVKSVKSDSLSPTANGHDIRGEEQEHSADDEQCQNCLQWIPRRTMVLHENFCRRNNVVCPKCRTVFQKSSDDWRHHWHCPKDDAYGNDEATQAKHDTLYHTERQCPSCSFTTNSVPDLARHRTSVCPGKIILCQFCHLEVPQEGDPFNPSAEVLVSGLTEHELADGARTTDCHLCSKIIRLRDMATHLKHHDLEKAHRARPEICRNANCGRTQHGVGRNGTVGSGTQMGQGPGNDLGLCSLCFSPLYVSLHDPEGKALRRRIERRYLTQMTQGCMKRWCHNEWCKTGRNNLGLESKGTSVAAVLPLVKPMVDTIRQTHIPMFFCVDEANQRRRTLAEMLASEGGWDLEWCVAGCEAEAGNGGMDIDRAREWLANWAPMKA